MRAEDKIRNKIDDLSGKAKEAIGRATRNKRLRREGKLNQAKASLRDAGEKIKDAFK